MDAKGLKYLALDIGCEWSFIATELGFKISQLSHLRTAYPFDSVQCTLVMLSKWTEVLDSQNIKPEPILFKALQDTDRQDLVDKFKEIYVTNGTDECDGVIPENDGSIPDYILDRIQSIEFRHQSPELLAFMEQSNRYMEAKRREKALFVPCKASKKALAMMQSDGFVAIIGNVGDGKTSIAIHTLSQLEEEGSTIIVFSDPIHIEKVYDEEKQIVYFVDDAFGTPRINMRHVESWLQLHEKLQCLIELKKCKVLMTSRKHVYQQCTKWFSKCSLYKDNVIDMSLEANHLTIVEKNRIIAKHNSKSSNNDLFPNYLQSIRSGGYVPGFPLLCTMYARGSGLTHDPEEFLLNPLRIVREQISLLAKTQIHSYCALVIIMMEDGELDCDIFDEFDPDFDEDKRKKISTILRACGLQDTDLSKIEYCVKEMVGVFVEERCGTYGFYHDSIFDAVCLEFGTKSPAAILNIASPHFIQLRIRTENIPGSVAVKESDYEDVLIMKKSKYHILAQRWIDDALKGFVGNVFRNPSVHDKDMLKAFIDRIFKLKTPNFIKFFGARDNFSSKTVLQKACKRGLSLLVSALTQKIMKVKEEDPEFSHEIPPACLTDAVMQHHLEIVQSLLESEANVNSQRPIKLQTGLHLASENGDINIVKILLKHKADTELIDQFLKRPVHYACEFNKSNILKLLLEHGAAFEVSDRGGRRPVHFACMSGSLGCLQALVEKGATMKKFDSSGKSILHYASVCKNPSLLEFVLKRNQINVNLRDTYGRSPLHDACFESIPRNVSLLIDKGVNLTQKDSTGGYPLHSACKHGIRVPQDADTCVKILLNCSEVSDNINSLDIRGKTPLHYVCSLARDKRVDTVKTLIQYGVDISVQDHHGNMALFYACENGNVLSISEMVRQGVDVNTADKRGRQPMHFACGKGNVEIVKLLKEKGASLTCCDETGKQPVHYASQYGNAPCLQYLLESQEVDPNAEDEKGQNPLHLACKWSKQAVVRLLVINGADPEQGDKDNRVPAQFVPKWSGRAGRIKRFLRGQSLNKGDLNGFTRKSLNYD